MFFSSDRIDLVIEKTFQFINQTTDSLYVILFFRHQISNKHNKYSALQLLRFKYTDNPI